MRTLLMIVLCFCLISCGFHTRGAMILPPPLRTLYLQTNDPYGQLTKNLTLYLKMSGVHLTKTPAEASSILDILGEKTSEQLLNISGTQATRQYNLTLTVNYRITDN